MRITLIGAVSILIAAVLLSLMLSRVLSSPIHDLIVAMQSFEKSGEGFSYEPVTGVREVENLSASFDHMVKKIQKLMATVRSEEVNLRKTELKALQAQINPHFLYNTLDSISWMCEQGKNAEAVVMVNALARLFRISISKGHELIPIRSEVQHAQSYLQIQSVRYKEQFSYHFDVQEDCTEYLCNKITLQPIIENAIYHGVNGLVDEGHIEIRVRAEGEDVLFTVEDNGVGMGAGADRGNFPPEARRKVRHRHQECQRPAENLVRRRLWHHHRKRPGRGDEGNGADAEGTGRRRSHEKH